jgi:hypothetical protein
MFKKVGTFILTFPIWVARIIVLGVIIFVGLGFFSNCQKAGNEPPVKAAPWEIQTYTYTPTQRIPSRLYYGEQFSTFNNIPALINWYEWNGKKYISHKGIISFPDKEWGAIDIVRRPG